MNGHGVEFLARERINTLTQEAKGDLAVRLPGGPATGSPRRSRRRATVALLAVVASASVLWAGAARAQSTEPPPPRDGGLMGDLHLEPSEPPAGAVVADVPQPISSPGPGSALLAVGAWQTQNFAVPMAFRVDEPVWA